jgi:hypothetical protein
LPDRWILKISNPRTKNIDEIINLPCQCREYFFRNIWVGKQWPSASATGQVRIHSGSKRRPSCKFRKEGSTSSRKNNFRSKQR